MAGLNFPEGTQQTGVWKLATYHNQTTGSTNPGGSWTNKLSGNTFTVPSGGSCICIVHGGSMASYETNGGQGEVRIFLDGWSGGSDHYGETIRGEDGHQDHMGGDITTTACFSIGSGTYRPHFQIRTNHGTWISNHYSSSAYLSYVAWHIQT